MSGITTQTFSGVACQTNVSQIGNNLIANPFDTHAFRMGESLIPFFEKLNQFVSPGLSGFTNHLFKMIKRKEIPDVKDNILEELKHLYGPDISKIIGQYFYCFREVDIKSISSRYTNPIPPTLEQTEKMHQQLKKKGLISAKDFVGTPVLNIEIDNSKLLIPVRGMYDHRPFIAIPIEVIDKNGKVKKGRIMHIKYPTYSQHEISELERIRDLLQGKTIPSPWNNQLNMRLWVDGKR